MKCSRFSGIFPENGNGGDVEVEGDSLNCLLGRVSVACFSFCFPFDGFSFFLSFIFLFFLSFIAVCFQGRKKEERKKERKKEREGKGRNKK